MAKAQWRQTGAGPHGDRRTHRNRDRQAQNRHAIEEQEEAASRRMVAKYAVDLDEEAELNDMLGLMDKLDYRP
jgi:hypothetical protein